MTIALWIYITGLVPALVLAILHSIKEAKDCDKFTAADVLLFLALFASSWGYVYLGLIMVVGESKILNRLNEIELWVPKKVRDNRLTLKALYEEEDRKHKARQKKKAKALARSRKKKRGF